MNGFVKTTFFFRRFFLYHNLSRKLWLRTCRAEQFFMSCSLKKPAGFSVECLHMLTCFTHDSCRPQTKQELFSAVRPTCCFCLWALGFACVRTNSFNIKTLPLFQIPTPLFTRATFYDYPMPWTWINWPLIILKKWVKTSLLGVCGEICNYNVTLWCDKLLPTALFIESL